MIVVEERKVHNEKTVKIDMDKNLNKENDDFIEKNLGLVHSCIGRFKGKGIEYDDLFSTGCIGLIKAKQAFKPELGFKFSTYAVPVILGEVKRLFRDGGTIKVSRSLKELSMKVVREKEKYINKYFVEPTVSQLAEIMGVSGEDIVEALTVSLPLISLTKSYDSEDDSQIDVAVSDPAVKFTEKLDLENVLNKLDGKDKQLIMLRYYQNKTQSEVAKVLGMTQVQVSRREKKILLQLRNLLQ